MKTVKFTREKNDVIVQANIEECNPKPNLSSINPSTLRLSDIKSYYVTGGESLEQFAYWLLMGRKGFEEFNIKVGKEDWDEIVAMFLFYKKSYLITIKTITEITKATIDDPFYGMEI